MEPLWYGIVFGMLAVYAVLDGFDFGAGIVHMFVARTNTERRTVLAAIGPVWDGNEVWLIAGGGVLFMAFPRAYSAYLSGFYLPLMMVLWLLILRGVAIEMRGHHDNPLWRDFWDAVFSLSSTLLAVVLGASLGNVVRGAPLGAQGFFAMPLFTDFRPGPQPGVFDWYTLLVAGFVLCLLTGHGALYLVWKTSGPVQERSRRCARHAWRSAIPLWGLATAATLWLRPQIFNTLFAAPWRVLFLVVMLASLYGVFHHLAGRSELRAFLSSSVFILTLFASTMTGSYPVLLRSTLDPAHHLTAANCLARHAGLQVALAWWSAGIALAAAYFAFLFYAIRGKVIADDDGPGY